MILPLDDRLREEARRFRLVFACPDCASFDPSDPEELGRDEPGAANARCALGYPIAPHVSRSLDDRDEIVFCKAFELR